MSLSAFPLHELLDNFFHDAIYIGLRDPLSVRANLTPQVSQVRFRFTCDEVVHGAPSYLLRHVVSRRALMSASGAHEVQAGCQGKNDVDHLIVFVEKRTERPLPLKWKSMMESPSGRSPGA